MEKYKDLTAIEILNVINKIKSIYDEKKIEAIHILDEMDKMDKNLDLITKEMEDIEMEYVKLMEILLEKQNNG